MRNEFPLFRLSTHPSRLTHQRNGSLSKQQSFVSDPILRPAHGTEIGDRMQADPQRKKDEQDRIKVVGDGMDEHAHPFTGGGDGSALHHYQTDQVGSPREKGYEYADRRDCRVQNEGELFTRDSRLIRKRTHDWTRKQRAEVIIDDQEAHCPCGQLHASGRIPMSSELLRECGQNTRAL